jgi:hypothetical protein
MLTGRVERRTRRSGSDRSSNPPAAQDKNLISRKIGLPGFCFSYSIINAFGHY